MNIIPKEKHLGAGKGFESGDAYLRQAWRIGIERHW
jgi:hypothetical protein